MQELEKKLISTRAASPLQLIGAQIMRNGTAIRFYPITLCESCACEMELPSGGFSWSEWGWYKGDYNRAEAYADSTQLNSHKECN